MNSKTGTLYIVATPIGNLADLSIRARKILSSVSLILAEDTRTTSVLLKNYDISTPTRACHEHNEAELQTFVVESLMSGQDLALVSDAGTPLISDPGYRIVSAVRDRNLNVSPIPGPSAVIAALCASGLPTDRFRFEGFLSSKSSKRKDELKQLADESNTLIFYESSHRIIGFLEDLVSVFGDNTQISLAREMTKKFESFYHGSAAEVLDVVSSSNNHQKGEFVVVVHHKADESKELLRAFALTTRLAMELPLKKASRIAAETFGVSRNACYEFGLKSDSD